MRYDPAVRVVFVVLVAACGRVGFEAPPATGHDEDGDRVADAEDVCPHLADNQADRDGDGVGDACDPEPDNPRQRIAVFATLQPDDQPLGLAGNGAWTQEADAVHFVGDQGNLWQDITVGDVRVALGMDVQAILGTDVQHQLALTVVSDEALPHDFVELNEGVGYSYAGVTHYDGTDFAGNVTQPLETGMHEGQVLVQTTNVVGRAIQLDGGWPAEFYTLPYATTSYQGASRFDFNIRNLEVDLRYVIVITSD